MPLFGQLLGDDDKTGWEKLLIESERSIKTIFPEFFLYKNGGVHKKRTSAINRAMLPTLKQHFKSETNNF